MSYDLTSIDMAKLSGCLERGVVPSLQKMEDLSLPSTKVWVPSDADTVKCRTAVCTNYIQLALFDNLVRKCGDQWL